MRKDQNSSYSFSIMNTLGDKIWEKLGGAWFSQISKFPRVSPQTIAQECWIIARTMYLQVVQTFFRAQEFQNSVKIMHIQPVYVKL